MGKGCPAPLRLKMLGERSENPAAALCVKRRGPVGSLGGPQAPVLPRLTCTMPDTFPFIKALMVLASQDCTHSICGEARAVVGPEPRGGGGLHGRRGVGPQKAAVECSSVAVGQGAGDARGAAAKV